MAIANFSAGDTGAAIRTKLNASLDASVTPFVQNKGFGYLSGALVIESDLLYISNAAIPDGTAFSVGISGATWKVVGSSSSANDRAFADDTTVAPAIAGAPTEAEMATFTAGASLTDTIVYYTGADVSGAIPTYVFHVDNSGNVTTLQTPSTAANDRAFADDTTVAPATAGAPTEAEIATFTAGASLLDTVVYYTGDDLSGSPATYVFHVDMSGNITTLQIPSISPFSLTFNAAADWGVASSGVYTLVIPAATHNVAAPVLIQVWEDTGGAMQLVGTDLVIDDASKDVAVIISEFPDARFSGKIVIS